MGIFVLSKPPKSDRPEHEGIWIGLTDRTKKHVYVWEDTGLLPTYTNWGPRQPDDNAALGADNVTGEDCAVIVHLWGGKWNDFPCAPTESLDKQNTLCEKGKFSSTNCAACNCTLNY